MIKHFPTSHLYLPEDLPIMETNHTFAAGSIWMKYGMDTHVATYDLFVRDMPPQRNFMVFGGLEEIIQDIQRWRYTREHIAYLKRIGVIGSAMERYLKNFRFRGDIAAMPEGTIFFPGEPIVRVTAPLIDASLFTLYFINVLVSHTIFFSKAIRSILVAKGKTVLGGGCRAHSFETNAKAVRALYAVGGGRPTTTAAICYKYHIPVPDAPVFLGQHAFIKSFDRERSAMDAFASVFPDQAAFMIDTYDFNQGLRNAIATGLALKKSGHRLRLVVIDSGNVAALAKKARRALDHAGLRYVKIFVAGNIDEYKLKRLIDKKIPADVYHVITELNTSSDAPKLEAVYKLAEIRNGKNIRYTAKFAPGKLSLPGRKQVFRQFDRRGIMQNDTIGLDGEKLGAPLLRPIFRHGKLVYQSPTLEGIRSYVRKQIEVLPARLRRIDREYTFPVRVSPKLKKLLATVRSEKIESRSS